MSRFDKRHKEASFRVARELMQQAGFELDEIQLTVDDAIRYHSCHDGQIPTSIEGKVLATADAQAHLLSDFYIHSTWAFGKEGQSLDKAKSFVLRKIEQDFHNKILFDEVREECRSAYDHLKAIFSR